MPLSLSRAPFLFLETPEVGSATRPRPLWFAAHLVSWLRLCDCPSWRPAVQWWASDRRACQNFSTNASPRPRDAEDLRSELASALASDA